MRHIVERAIKDGAVACVIVYETAGGRVISRTVPGLSSVRTGLLSIMATGVEE